jgi:hypothetical protein
MKIGEKELIGAAEKTGDLVTTGGVVLIEEAKKIDDPAGGESKTKGCREH